MEGMGLRPPCEPSGCVCPGVCNTRLDMITIKLKLEAHARKWAGDKAVQ